MLQHCPAHLPRPHAHLQVAGAQRRKERCGQAGQSLPIRRQRVHIGRGDAAVQVRGQVVAILSLGRCDVARDVEVVVVGLDLGQRHQAAVAGDLAAGVEGAHDAVDVALAQAILGAVLAEAGRRVHHEDACAAVRLLLVQHEDARRDARAVEEVGGQADDAGDEAAAHQLAADVGFGVAAEEHAVGQDHRGFAGALHGFQDVQQEGVVAVARWRDAVLEAPEGVVGRVHPAGPVLLREGRVGDHEVVELQAAGRRAPVRVGQGVALPDLSVVVAVQDHVHARQTGGGVVHFLAVDGQPVRRLVGHLDQQRAGAAGRVVDSLLLADGLPCAHDLRHHPRDLGRGVELPLALAALGGEVAHQVLVGVAQQVIPFGAVGAQVNALEDADQPRQAIHHLAAAAQLRLVVEVGDVDHALQVVGFRQPADDLVDLVADLRVALQPHHVGEGAALRHKDRSEALARVLVRDVLDEEQREDVVLVLRGVHAPAQLVARFPERRVELRFLERHGQLQVLSRLRHAAAAVLAAQDGAGPPDVAAERFVGLTFDH